MSAWGQLAQPATQQTNGTNGRTPAYAAPETAPKVFKGCSKITEYDVLRKLGEGTFGEVYQAKHKATGNVFAVKKIIMHNEKDGFPITALREIKLLKLLKHENVLRLEEMAVERAPKGVKTITRATMYMVTQYMDHDLSGLLENRNVPFGVPQVKCYMLQLLKGLAYIHGQNILHRDMKAANLLINNKGILQIADFGLARHYEGDPPTNGYTPDAVRDYTALVVTRWYRPPELLMQLRRYTPAIDVWGVGCVFGEMLERKPILAGESDHKQLDMIFDLLGVPTEDSMPGFRDLPGGEHLNLPHRTPTISMRFKGHAPGTVQFLADLLNLNWKKRISASDAINHPYFKESPFPARPEDLPHYEESHELDKRGGHPGRKVLPPAPRGYAVGEGGANGNGDGWGNGNGHNRPPHDYRNNGHHDSRGIPSHRGGARQPMRWDRPRHDPTYGAGATWGDGGGSYSDRPHGDRDYREREHRGDRRGADVYVPSYGADGRRDDRRDDRRRGDSSYDRRPLHRDRLEPRLDYDERARGGGRSSGRRTRSRSRSPVRDRARTRERDSPDRSNVYRR